MNNQGAESIIFSCLECAQPLGHYYIGVMDAKDIVAISWTDVRRMQERDLEAFVGIQRPLDKNREKELGIYVNTEDASFPTGVILSVESSAAVFDPQKKEMIIEKRPDVAKIIDGQHRIAGLSHFKEGSFQISVAIFIDLEIEFQAMMFATINLKQTRVSKSLAYDLFEYEKSRSPQRTCHLIARLAGKEPESPFFQRIKILGPAIRQSEVLTQATFVEALMALISPDKFQAMKDRDVLRKGGRIDLSNGQMLKKCPLRNVFAQEKDVIIADIILNYFWAVRDRWPKAWNSEVHGSILPKSTGFLALMKFLKRVLVDIYGTWDKRKITKSDFAVYFSKSPWGDSDFTKEEFIPGATGISKLYHGLMTSSRLEPGATPDE